VSHKRDAIDPEATCNKDDRDLEVYDGRNPSNLIEPQDIEKDLDTYDRDIRGQEVIHDEVRGRVRVSLEIDNPNPNL
jgi:hypothetical protein